MPDYVVETEPPDPENEREGSGSFLMIRDTGYSIEFHVLADTTMEAMPYSITVDGVTTDRTFNLQRPEEGDAYFQLMYVVYNTTKSQTVTLAIPDTDNYTLRGPAQVSGFIVRGDLLGSVRIKVGNTYKRATPYVNVNGRWRVAEPWSKAAGIWKQAT